MARIGAIETGGTKRVLVVGDENGTIFEREEIPTMALDSCAPKMLDWFASRNVDSIGLASGPAIEHRWGMKADKLADDARVWEIEASYLAEGILTYVLYFSPQRIVLGGGVMHQTQLFPLIRDKISKILGGYITAPE